MGHKLLLDVAPTGVQHSVEVDENGFYAIEHTPTVVEEEIIDNCSRLRGLNQRKGAAFQFAGQIPIGLHAVWKKEWRENFSQLITWPTFLAQKMNSTDFKKLRTTNGALPTTHNRRMI